METLLRVKALAIEAAANEKEDQGSYLVYPPGEGDMRPNLPLFAKSVARVFIAPPSGPAREVVPVVNALQAYHEKIARFRREQANNARLKRLEDDSTVSHLLTNDEATSFMRGTLAERVSMAQARIATQFEATGRRIHRSVARVDAHLGGVGGE